MTESRINPLAFTSLQNLNIEAFEEDVAREIQKKKYLGEKNKVSILSIVYNKYTTIQYKFINSENSKNQSMNPKK